MGKLVVGGAAGELLSCGGGAAAAAARQPKHTTNTKTHAPRSSANAHTQQLPTKHTQLGKEGKITGVPMEPAAFVAAVQEQLAEVQGALLAQATEFRDANIVDVASYDELKAAIAEGASLLVVW